ncbi:protein-disulfide reductase DsbD [Catenovulum sp. SM1970]|uniref:protein-disulfide reductase DsbD n=1 Tax=Marinifaba aquimaris TaxID=2741323 RepID=UPI001574DB5F|nr:protein-disulfide reductase DsbD [Marinifaba aquimaris]NTS75317.1 protein-disulfide reductase DsbD [Marinifaba aquimaris]
MKSWLSCLVIFINLFFVSTSLAQDNNFGQNKLDFLDSGTGYEIIESEPDFLPVEQAFISSYQQQADVLTVSFDIEKGYYLYQAQFKFKGHKASSGEVLMPEGEPYEDEYFGNTQIYKGHVSLTIPLNFALENSVLNLRYQGCAEAGLCYPPSILKIPLNAINTQSATDITTQTGDFDLSANEFSLSQALSENSLPITLALFFALGVGLSLTPCVFPMYPILSSILVGPKGDKTQLSNKQALLLSFVFVQGMALTYALLGLVAASAGAGFQAALQSPWVLGFLTLLFIALSGAMFGFYEIQLPSRWVNKLSKTSDQQQSGKLKSALIMGILSGLIASPCTTAPLSGALLYVAQTGDLFIGFISLYILSLGMGLPLLIIGASSGKWLPKAGSWMEQIKKLFGFFLLAVPLMLMARFVDEYWILVLSTLLAIACVIYFAIQFIKQNSKVLSAIISGLSCLVLVYFAQLTLSYQKLNLPFTDFKQIEQLERAIENADKTNSPVILNITAEWCVGCKEFKHLTFADQSVQDALSDYTWLQLDVTEYNSEQDQYIKSLNLVGPPAPTVMIFDEAGQELVKKRIRGFLPPEAFIEAVTK